jgi:hypothetical protein
MEGDAWSAMKSWPSCEGHVAPPAQESITLLSYDDAWLLCLKKALSPLVNMEALVKHFLGMRL